MRGPLKLFSDAVAHVRQNSFLYVGIVIGPMLLSYVADLFMPPENTGVVRLDEWSVYLVLLLISVVASVLMTVALTLALENPSLTIGQSYRAALGFFWRYLGLSVVMSVLLMIGFLLLFVPGVILFVWFTFATFVLILEKASIVDSLKRSREYTRGRWWGILGRLVAMTALSLVLVMIFGIVAGLLLPSTLGQLVITLLSALLVPVMVGYMYLMYQDARSGGAAVQSGFAPDATGVKG